MSVTSRPVRWLLGIVMAGMALLGAGCSARAEVPRLVIQPAPLGLDVFCTREAFYERFPAVAQHDRRPLSSGVAWSVSGFALSFSESMGWSITCGVYDPTTSACWVVCRDPAAPTAEERSWMAHEHCHRVQHLEGWPAAAPLWDRLPQRLHTHPEIEARLVEWRRTHQG